jgi:hypothetical protein
MYSMSAVLLIGTATTECNKIFEIQFSVGASEELSTMIPENNATIVLLCCIRQGQNEGSNSVVRILSRVPVVAVQQSMIGSPQRDWLCVGAAEFLSRSGDVCTLGLRRASKERNKIQSELS